MSRLTPQHIEWQQHRLVIFDKHRPGSPYPRRRIVPMSPRIRALVEHHFALHENLGMSVRTIQRKVKQIANRALCLAFIPS